MSTLRLNGSFQGFDTGNAIVNSKIEEVLTVAGSVSDVEFDMDILGAANVFTDIRMNPIVDISGISGEITGSLFGAGSISAGFILKQISLDGNGDITRDDDATVKTVPLCRGTRLHRVRRVRSAG